MSVVKRSKNPDKEKSKTKQTVSTSQKLNIRLVDERQPVLLEQLQSWSWRRLWEPGSAWLCRHVVELSINRESWRSVSARRGRWTPSQPRLMPFARLIGGTEDEQLGSLRTRRGFQDHPGEQLDDNKQLFSSLVLRDSDVCKRVWCWHQGRSQGQLSRDVGRICCWKPSWLMRGSSWFLFNFVVFLF